MQQKQNRSTKKRGGIFLLILLCFFGILLWKWPSFQRKSIPIKRDDSVLLNSYQSIDIITNLNKNNPATTTLLSSGSPAVPDLPIDQLKGRFAEIADEYEHSLKYPTYSIPLAETQWDLLHPNAFIPVKGTVADPPISLELVLPHYTLFREEPFFIQLKVTSLSQKPLPVVLEIHGEWFTPQKILERFPLRLVYNTLTEQHFQKDYSPSHPLPDEWPDEIYLRVVLTLEGQGSHQQTTVLRYVATQALVMGVGVSFVQAEHLMIPLQIQVKKAGKYRIRANLFDSGTGLPVAHLNQKFPLGMGDQTLELKVHSVTLKTQQSPGPYRLQDFLITRVPDRPGLVTEYGRSRRLTFVVEGHDLNHYADVPYHNEESQQRLEWLRRVGKTEN